MQPSEPLSLMIDNITGRTMEIAFYDAVVGTFYHPYFRDLAPEMKLLVLRQAADLLEKQIAGEQSA